MPLTCRPLDDASAPAWDAFVKARPEGTFFHLSGWRHIIARAFGHPSHYVLAERDGAIVGVLPLGQVKTRLFGHSLISVPFCVYGGPLAADMEALTALEAHAAGLMRRLEAPVLEFRWRDEPPPFDPAQWQTRSDLYVTFRKPFTGDDAANLKAVPRKQRAMVRKGIDRGLVSVIDTDTSRLHRIYAESVRNLGTPVFGRRFFEILMETFRDEVDIVTVLDGSTAIASVLSFYFRHEVLPYYGGGRAIARERYGNDFMYWEVMRRAASRGFRLFDFGRSKVGTGSFAFKKNWGFVPSPMHYSFRLAPGASIPDTNPLNPKYRLMIAAWKRLPLPVANLIGPHVVRGVG
jgi:FemAB-related protein (PEP-CTERM system-associated)